MTPEQVFHAAAPFIAPAIEQAFGRRDLCIFSTRVAIEVARYFGVSVEPLAVRAIFANVDRSWTVGAGHGHPAGCRPELGWDGHLIAIAGEDFADFSAWNAERPQRGIILGPAIVGKRAQAEAWAVRSEHGVHIQYECSGDARWRAAPDWRDEKRRRPVVAAVIRAMKRRVPLH